MSANLKTPHSEKTGILARIERINNFRPENFAPFIVAGQSVGRIRRDNLPLLREWPDVFEIDAGESAVRLAARLDCYENRTEAMAEIARRLEQRGVFTYPLMNERYPVLSGWGKPPLLEIERNATIFFGLSVFGVHINGYFYEKGRMKVWLQVRSRSLRAWPGQYDQMAAGGQPVGIPVRENMIKELAEEALLPREVSQRAIPVGTISYAEAMREGVRVDTLFVFDLELPEGVAPKPDFDEVEAFESFDAEEILTRLKGPDDGTFKPNAALVMADFFIRRGMISAEDCPDYCEIIKGLRKI